MSHELFRREAVSACTDSRHGHHIFHQPISVRIAVIGVTLIFLAFVVFAALARVKQTELVRGHLTPVEGEIKVYSDSPGIFREIHGNEGQHVHRGDILATVLHPRHDAGGRQSSLVLLEHTDQQISQLQERMIALKERALIAEEQTLARIAGLGRELMLMQEEYEVVLKRLDIAEEEYRSSLILLDRNSISSREHNQTASAWYSLLQMSKGARLNMEGRKLALEEANQQLSMQPLTLRDELLGIQNGNSQLPAHRDELSLQGLFAITAPAEGTLANVISRVGDTADPRIPFATLVPVNHVLEARLYLPSRSVGEVAIGQDILLSYDAYPYQTHGTFAATIVSVSTTTMDPREFLIPLELNEPVYLVHAQIAQQGVGTGIRLRPGMHFTAEIVTGSNSLLERLIAPLSSLGRKL
ncbi:MAG: HlyD family efflux transporter periplasmic adaptor subunit [Gammaproteobacteria bacterium]|nr:HlyD family efflux transporter periplasmic adaptor subunit [Gammaproteobacteria bacterium]